MQKQECSRHCNLLPGVLSLNLGTGQNLAFNSTLAGLNIRILVSSSPATRREKGNFIKSEWVDTRQSRVQILWCSRTTLYFFPSACFCRRVVELEPRKSSCTRTELKRGDPLFLSPLGKRMRIPLCQTSRPFPFSPAPAIPKLPGRFLRNSCKSYWSWRSLARLRAATPWCRLLLSLQSTRAKVRGSPSRHLALTLSMVTARYPWPLQWCAVI